MAKNKTFHHVYFIIEEKDHPIIVDWFHSKLVETMNIIRAAVVESGLRSDSVTMETFRSGSMFKLTFHTNFLGDQMLYSSMMGYISRLIDMASKYVDIKMEFESTDVRKNRLVLTADQGLLINGAAPIEMRDVGLIAQQLDKKIIDMWVAGEPNATRKEVGRIRQMLRYENGYKKGLEWFIAEIKTYMPKNVALYIRTVDSPLGQVVHCNRAYGYSELSHESHMVYLKDVESGKVPDIFNLKESHNLNFDFIAFMASMLDVVDARREKFKGFGGYEIVPSENEQAVDIMKGTGFDITFIDNFTDSEDEWLKRQVYIDQCKYGRNLNWTNVD